MEARAAQARIESELAVARQIQLDAMPLAAVTADEADSVEVAAVLEPAREVGGDLYDVFTLEDGRLLFIIGDVSGKGVPAASSMVYLSARFVRIVARGTACDLPEVMGAVNRYLAENNPTRCS